VPRSLRRKVVVAAKGANSIRMARTLMSFPVELLAARS
jgi:hypothetical protein